MAPVDGFLAVLAERLSVVVGDNVTDFGRKAGMSESEIRSLRNWIANPGSMKIEQLPRIAAAANRPLGWFLGEDLRRDTVTVPVLDVRAAAGGGYFNDVSRKVTSFPFPLSFIEHLGGNPHKTECLRVTGDSMLPTIESGALLLVDRSQDMIREPKKQPRGRGPLPRDEIFVFIQGDALRIKRLRRLSRDLLAIISDNVYEHPPEILDRDEAARIKIIGKVIWWDNRL